MDDASSDGANKPLDLRPARAGIAPVSAPPLIDNRPLPLWSQWLRAWARSSLPGRESAFRKFRRRHAGRPFVAQANAGFRLAGTIGDAVENSVAIRGEFEPGLTRFFFEAMPAAAAFVDLGCNVGYFSCLYRRRRPDGRLLAIDANPRMAETCRENLALNGAADAAASVLHSAVGPERGAAILSIPRHGASLGTLGQPLADAETITVPMDTLESLLDARGFPAVDLLKMDVEGFEPVILRSLSPAVAGRFGLIVFEFADSNFRQCGFARDDFASIPWLADFETSRLDEAAGTLHPLPRIVDFPGPEGTVVLRRK